MYSGGGSNMKFARLSIMFSIIALLFSGCGSQTSSDKPAEVKSEAQQTQDTQKEKVAENKSNSNSRPSHEARYQPLPSDFNHEKYNITGYANLEVRKMKRQVENGIYIPKKRIDFASVSGMIEGSKWTIQRIIANDYCIEVHAIRQQPDGRKLTWYLYEDGSWSGTQQFPVFVTQYDGKGFDPEHIEYASAGGANATIALVAAYKVLNQYGAHYIIDSKYDSVIKEY